MPSLKLKSALLKSALAATALLLGGAAFAQTTVNLTAQGTTTTLPDGMSVPMWGLFCNDAGTGGSCVGLSSANATASTTGPWSPPVITVPVASSGATTLTVNLTNKLPAGVPTSLIIVGQLGGGLGTPGGATQSPDHTNAQAVTWPIAGSPPGAPPVGVGTPPAQGARVQSFGAEVATGATGTLTWSNLKAGTYLIESGTHPSIQAPMGLYGILVVTTAPTSSNPSGCAYPDAASTSGACLAAATYKSEIPMLFSEIDPVQNNSVNTAVNTPGFAESNVWAGLTPATTAAASAVLCRDVTGSTVMNGSAPAYGACYPPAVNYTPLYYLINGVAFDKTHNTNSLFPSSVGTAATPVSGTVLVRLVNAGLRMHVPAIVGAQTGTATPAAAGFALIAEDGNALPGVSRVQTEVFMPAGKTNDVMINVPAAGGTALPIYDRELSLSGNATERDAGMLAYIGVNGAGLPSSGAFGSGATTVTANPDSYFVVTGQPLVVADPGKGLISNDVNVYGVQVVGTAPAGLTLNADGTFTYSGAAPTSSSPIMFTYCGNGATAGSACAQVTLAACTGTCLEGAGNLTATTLSYNANGTFIKIQPPGVLSGITDKAGHPLTVDLSAGNAPAPSAGLTLAVDPTGGFSASVGSCAVSGCSATFKYRAVNSQGTASPINTVTINFLAGSGLNVTVIDGKDLLNGKVNAASTITDYRWIIEEDRTFYMNPNCTANPPAAGCPGSSTGGGVPGIVPTFGTNFHTSHMPVIATGCTGPLSCEGGQTVYDPVSGTHVNAVCDLGNGACRADTSGNGFTATFPSQVHLDPNKRYYLSVLPGDAANPFEAGNLSADCTNGQSAAQTPGQCGHGMGGAPIAGAQITAPASNPVKVLTEPAPYPPAKLSVFVFEDDFPLNGEHDAGGGIDVLSPNEPGLGGFNITIFDDAGGSGDATGQVTYDMFNQPLSNSLAGTIDPATGLDACPTSKISRIGPQLDSNGNPITGTLDPTQTGITGTILTCPKYESDGKTLSPLAGQAVVANLFPGRYGIVATPSADAISRGEEWLQTNTLDGQKAHDSFLRIGEPSFFQEFGPAGYHVSIGFANPAIINARLQYICNGADPNSPQPGTPYHCNNTVTGQVTTERMSRTPDERLYSSGDYTSFSFTQCYVSFGDADGEDFAFTKCNADGTFTLSGLPEGTWRVTVFDQWNDMLVDGLSTPVQLGGGNTTALGQIATNQWQANIYTNTFFDNTYTGVRTDSTTAPQKPGLALVVTNNRFRDGSFSNFNNTDLSGNAGFNEIFPLFNWYVIETDSTRYKNTGTHVVYDAGGPADGTPCGNGVTGPGGQPAPTAPCGTSAIAAGLANTAEIVPLPTNLRVPGAVYCTGADCFGSSISSGPIAGGSSGPTPGTCTISPTTGQTSCTGPTMSTGRIDPPWVVAEAWQGFSGENQIIEFGKKPYADGENGGIHGHVVYASTRPFDDPQLLLQLSWEPLVPNVTINLYQVGTAPDGTASLTLVDTTTTSSWDDWAQGFRTDGMPNMNCPGQLGAPTSGAAGDLFFFTLANQPMYLDMYANGGTPAHTLPNNAQFKCYDGMHNWNQVQPAPYDGMYQFPSVTAMDPKTGLPTGTNCSICVVDPDATDPYRYGGKPAGTRWTAGKGTPMLPRGQYVVEVVVPPGFELVKEEDKNILIGDNYIAPVTVQFPGLGSAIYIIPDQASVAAAYNANQGSLSAFNGTNPQNLTQALGRISSLPSHEGDTGSVETYWPCVGATRIVPDFISLFPNSAEVSPFAGATRHLCDRKLVTLDDQTQALAKFYVFTSTHIAAHFTGVITDDFTSEFDPYSPQFGEKFSPANLPVAIKDWTGQEVSRVYADQWGTYNGLTYSTWEVNPPNPTGYAPTMMVTCMNDAGTGATPDPLYQPAYSQFCYEIPFMPGQTQYMDTPVVPTSAFAGAGYNNADCDYPDTTPAISEVDVDGNIGPWGNSPASSHTIHIYALGTVSVDNYAYSGPSATTAPFNAKKVARTYSFGSATGSVQLRSMDGSQSMDLTPGSTWTDSAITATIAAFPTGNGNAAAAWNCPVQQQAQYGGPGSGSVAMAKCAQLVITAANGRQSIDAVTVTIGGKAPTHVSPTASIQSAIDAAKPGDMLIIDPLAQAAAGAPAQAAVHQEMLLMWKPLRLQGVGATASIVNANTHPAGKLDSWRRQVNCLFGLSVDGYQSLAGGSPFAPYDRTGTYKCATSADFGAGTTTLFGFQPTATNPQVDRLPLEAVIGWTATLNGNLAELLQEPSLMGALEGAAITVLSKGVYIPNGSTDIFGGGAATAGAYPTGTIPVSSSTSGNRNNVNGCGPNTMSAHNPFPSNFLCNPSSIDGLTVENSSQGGGGIFVHGWGHNLQIANNRVTNNAGTLSGGINVGQGEFPNPYTIGGTNEDPGSCQTSGYSPNANATGKQLPYCFDLNVNMHNNMVTRNSSTGDELFSATPAGAGGVTICNGSDYYKFNYNWVCGNLSGGDGGGVGHVGFSYNGDIEHNTIIFNQSTNPTIATNGGGLLIMGAPDADPPCGAVTDVDCVPTPVNAPSDGVGPNLVINANLIQGNSADSGSGGGLRFQGLNGSDVLAFPRTPSNWFGVTVTNNIIVNNVAGWDGGGVSLVDALDVNIVNNTIMSNDSTASSGMLFNTLGAPLASSQGPCPVARNADGTCPVALTQSTPQPAGLVAIQNSSNLATAMATLPVTGGGGGARWTCPAGHFTGNGNGNNGNCGQFSYPELYNNVFWQNRSFSITVGGLGTGPINQQNVVVLQPALNQPSTDGTTANGSGVVITGGTGACVPEPSFSQTVGGYWDIGVRGDPSPSAAGSSGNAGGGPGTVTNPRLAPTYSLITDFSDYAAASLHNTGANPTVLMQYCNGSRVPPENGGLGYDVPPGIADATVPNPIFNLTPAATVDEGNNWINMSWGPLSLVNTSNGSQNGQALGNYGLASGSAAIDYIPTNASTYGDAPSDDFYGTLRKTTSNPRVDAGAVEFTGAAAPAPTLTSINPNTGARSSTVAVTLTGTNLTGTSAITVSGNGITVSGITVVNSTTVTANFTISATAAQTQRTVSVNTPGGTSNTVNFTVVGRTLTGLTPAAGVRGTAVGITITGSQLTGATGLSGTGNGITVSNFTVVNDTTITATLTLSGGANLGMRNIGVTGGAAGNSTNTEPFTVSQPTLTGITPAQGTHGTSVNVNLSGSGLTGVNTVSVSGNGITVSAVTVVNDTTVTARFAITNGANLTARNVSVRNAGGATSGNVTFTVQ
jgi:hypothetical protein